MPTKKPVSTVSAKDIDKVTAVLEKLVLQGRFAHMQGTVNKLMSGVLLPTLIEQGEVDPNDPDVIELMNSCKDTEVVRVIRERPVYRRLKDGLNKVSRKTRELSTEGRDILIRWWNVNQRLIPKEDQACVTLTAQVNALRPSAEPLSALQIAGYFSHLCRMGLRTEDERVARLSASLNRGAHTIMPVYTQALLDAIYANWEFERANEAALHSDHIVMRELREKGVKSPVIAKVEV
jgi:hypothetical protein